MYSTLLWNQRSEDRGQKSEVGGQPLTGWEPDL
jgi:hypothetical protein